MFRKSNHAEISSQVEQIMAKNRALYGGWSMSITPSEPTPPTPAEPPVATVTPPVPTPPADRQAALDGVPLEQAPPANPWDDPKAAQAEIERLRRENGAARTNAKTAAADEARKELAQTIGKALGLVEDEQIDPAKLTESLTTAQADAKRAQVALAVYQNAGTAGGDPVALLDSTTFLKSVAAIDPSDPAAISAAITAAITANPRLGAAPADPRTPAPNPAQGGSASGAGGVDYDADIATAQSAGDFQKVIALRQQRAAELRTKP